MQPDNPPVIDAEGKSVWQVEREIEMSILLYGQALVDYPRSAPKTDCPTCGSWWCEEEGHYAS